MSNDGTFINAMRELTGDNEGSLSDPLNVVVDNEGMIFVSDKATGPPRIKAFAQDGKYFYGFAPKGTGAGKVKDTRGMAFDSEQRLYIGDIDNMRISVFEHSGEFV